MPIIGDITKKPLIDTNANTKPRTRRNWQRAGATIGATAAGVTVSPTGGIIDGTAGLYINVDGTTTAINGSNQLVASGSSSGVTGVALAGSPVFSITGTPVTTAGTLTLNFVDGGTHDFLAVNSLGTATLRAITAADLPAGVGSVTSVGLTGSPVFSISGSPITTAGTITLGFANGGTSDFLAVNATGTATLRAIATADLPATYPTVLYSGVQSNIITNTTAFTAFNLVGTLAAGSLNRTGALINVAATYDMKPGGGNNLSQYLKIGTITLATTTAISLNGVFGNNVQNCAMNYTISVITAGTAGEILIFGNNSYNGYTTEPAATTFYTPIDLTQSYTIGFAAQWQLASSANTIQLADFILEQLA